MELPKKLDTNNKVMITVAPVGSYPTKKDNPNLPITPEKIAIKVYRAYNAGASVVHLHARNLETYEPTADPAIYRAIVEAVRERCPEIIIQLSTGTGAAKLGLSPEERIEHWVRREGLVPEPLSYSLVLGVIGGIPATVKNLINMVDALPEHCIWQVIAMGRFQIPLGTVGVIMGGGIRVGFEDNIYLSRGILAKSNAELVEKAVRIIREVGREVASARDTRQTLQI